MQGSGKDGGGFDVDTAHNNKTVLLLCAGLLLLIFMDLQARRHSRSLAESTGRSVAERASDLESKFEPILRPVRKSAREAFGAAGGSVVAAPTPRKHTVDAARRRIGDALKSAGRDSAPHPAVGFTPVNLYFLRFQGGRPRAARVRRAVAGPISPERLLQLLREGPLASERGLLSAVESVPFGAVHVQDGVAIVEAGSALGRNGARLVRARIEQVVLTLTQIPGIQSVKFSINGEVVDTVAGVPVQASAPKRAHRVRQASRD